jgi:membrane protease subunit HflK
MPSPSRPPSLPGNPNFQLNFKAIIGAIAALLVVIGAFTCFYQVSAESVGVVQRFGRFSELAEPGLRFKLPFGIDSVVIVPVQRQLKLEFGYGTPTALNPYQASSEAEAERDMVTGDTNAASVEWVVQYRISNPRDYLFELRDPEKTLRDLSEAVMREVVGDRTVDEVLTSGRQEIASEVLAKLQPIVDKLTMGLSVELVQLGNVNPPRPVQSSFNEVNAAQQERETAINVALGEYNKVVPKARGEAEQKISEAEGYALKRVNEAEGDVAGFKAQLEQYEKAPDVTRQRIYLETMGQVIPQLGSKIIIDEKAQQFLPLMHLQQPQRAQR